MRPGRQSDQAGRRAAKGPRGERGRPIELNVGPEKEVFAASTLAAGFENHVSALRGKKTKKVKLRLHSCTSTGAT